MTAGNSSPLNDGASAVVLASPAAADELGVEPLARVVASATHALDPQVMGIAPAFAIPKALERVAWPRTTSTSGRSTRPTRRSPSRSCASCRASSTASRSPTSDEHVIELPDPVYSVWAGREPRLRRRRSALRLHVARHARRRRSTTTSRPRESHAGQADAGARRLRPRRCTRPARLWATAPDGTQVPISVVHRKDVAARRHRTRRCSTATAPTRSSIDPTFSSIRLSLLDRGFVFAIAHIRGGGELGRRWYEDGKLLHKRNTFTDFIACAEHLVRVGLHVARPARRARRQRGRAARWARSPNLRPDLFRAVVAEVPFVDVVTTMLDPTLPLTVTEWEEWGNPIDDPEVYAYMKSYSPYDNVAGRRIPRDAS